MDGMTPELAFRARELSEAGVWSGRIASMLSVDEILVRRALAGDTFEPVVPAVADHAPMAKLVRRDDEWPPPVDESTRWDVVRVRGRGPDIRVRWVRLWGQEVQINEAADVWCPGCCDFRTTEQLSDPWNSCPVGLPRRGGIRVVPEAEMLAEAAKPVVSELDQYWAAQAGRWW